MLGSIDWLVLGLYLAVVLAMGFYARKGQESTRDYLLAGGTMPWWAVGISLIATSVSTTSMVGTPAESFSGDLRYLCLNLPVPLSILLVTVLFIPWFRRQGVASAYEALQRRFNRRVRLLAASLYSLHVLLRTGVLVYGPALVLAEVTGLSLWVTIVLVGLSAVVYSAVGGLKAVIWTDVLQFAVLFGGAVITCLVIEARVDGGLFGILALAREAGKTRVLDTSFSLSDSRNLWAAGVAYLALDLAIRATDQQFVQRYLSVSSVARAQGAALLAALLGFAVSMLFFLLGLHLWAFYQQFPPATPFADPNSVLPAFVTTHLHGGLAGVLVAGIFAAAMSSIDSAIAALSSTITLDFFGNRRRDDKSLLAIARTSLVVFGLLSLGFAFFAATFTQSLLNTALSFTSLFTGSLLGIFTLAILPVRLKPDAVLLGGLLGAASLWVVTSLSPGDVAWPYLPVISFTATVAWSLGLSALPLPGVKANTR